MIEAECWCELCTVLGRNGCVPHLAWGTSSISSNRRHCTASPRYTATARPSLSLPVSTLEERSSTLVSLPSLECQDPLCLFFMVANLIFVLSDSCLRFSQRYVLQITVFWNVTPWSLRSIYQCFGRTSCLRLQWSWSYLRNAGIYLQNYKAYLARKY